MLRITLAIVGMITILGGALLGSSSHVPSQRPVTPVEFAQVQATVNATQTAHITFQVQSGGPSAIASTHEIWLQTAPATFAIRSEKAQILGNANGVTQFAPGKAPKHLSQKPMTRAAIQEKMLSPYFGANASAKTRQEWGTPTIVRDGIGRPFIQFNAEDNGIHRTLWVDAETHLPTLIEMKTVADREGEEQSADERCRILFDYNSTPPADIFAPPATKRKASAKPPAK